MEVTIKGKNLQVSDALKDYPQKKVSKLEQHFATIKEAVVTMSQQRTQHIVEVTLEGDGVLIRGEERSQDMYASIDQVVEKLDKQISKLKSKLIEKPRSETARVQAEIESAAATAIIPETAAEAEEPRIVRTKRVAVKPMPPDEAAQQMELLDHDFFVFLNSETGQLNVLYRRKDGNYGLIEPEAE